MKRAYERLLNEMMEMFPCVVILGPRQCGKTTLLQTLPKEWKFLDLERQADLDVVGRDPDLFFRLHPGKVAVDEAQMLPALFPALRIAIDAQRNVRGRYVITGSSSPGLLSSVSESLAGRVAIIEMSPFSWSEVHPRSDRDFVKRLCDRTLGPEDLLHGVRPRGDDRRVHDYWFRGGYPEPWVDGTERFRQKWMDQYVRTYLDRDVARLFPGLDHVKSRLFLQHLAGYSGTVINVAEVARALGVSQPTARDYFEIAHGTFVWRRVPAFVKAATRRMVRHSKGYLRDTGLLHFLLRIPDVDGLRSHPRLGGSWEGLVIEEVMRQLNANGASFEYSHYRTAGGAEVDLVLEGDMGLVAVEIKYGQTTDWRTVKTIQSFLDEQKARLGLVIGNDSGPHRLAERIISLPFACL